MAFSVLAIPKMAIRRFGKRWGGRADVSAKPSRIERIRFLENVIRRRAIELRDDSARLKQRAGDAPTESNEFSSVDVDVLARGSRAIE